MSSPIERRAFLRLTVAGVAGAAAGVPLGACGAGSPSPDPGSRRARPGNGRILLAFFSRPGENYWSAAATVLLASPIWNVRAPMIMTTFCREL